MDNWYLWEELASKQHQATQMAILENTTQKLEKKFKEPEVQLLVSWAPSSLQDIPSLNFLPKAPRVLST